MKLSLAGLPICNADFLDDDLATFAAIELARYLRRLAGQPNPMSATLPERGGAIVLQRDAALPAQGHRLWIADGRLHLAAAESVALLHGVYGLLERLGMGFYNGGDHFPELPAPVTLPMDLDASATPAFAVRGNMLHYNFLCGPTVWGLEDYKYYFDQLARQRMNLLLMHWYDGEPGAALELDGHFLAGGGTPSTLTKPWGARAALRSSQFSFGVGRYFAEEVFSSPIAAEQPHPIDEIARSEAMFREAIAYAAGRGVRIAAGFEAPHAAVSPTDPEVAAHFIARLDRFLAAYPGLGYFALWQHESGGCVGAAPPAPGTPAAALLEARRADFAYLGTEPRVWEAIRYGEFARLAAEHLAKVAPQLPLVVVGWGGDRWMRFADYCLAYDRLLPASVIFTCHDNIDASLGDTVSGPWGELPAARQRWAMPWIEADTNDCWSRQPAVEPLAKLVPDAHAKGCQGLLNLQWRTADLEEENAFCAAWSWTPPAERPLSLDAFSARYAGHAYGADWADAGGALIARLQRLGARWTGMPGPIECGRMIWGGWDPPFPIERDAAAMANLSARARAAALALSRPAAPTDGSDGAFHLQRAAAMPTEPDLALAEVRAFMDAAAQLDALAAAANPADPAADAATAAGLYAVHEAGYALRATLVRDGMDGPAYRAVDGYLLALHHTWRCAAWTRHAAILADTRAALVERRDASVLRGRHDRVARLDTLIATIDMVTHFDAVQLLLKPDGEVAQALATLETAAKEAASAAANSPSESANSDTVPPSSAPSHDLAAALYQRVVDADMRAALLAQTRKLRTRCEWGVLATMAVKPLPLYWETLDRLAALMPVAPPRQPRVQGRADCAWLAWDSVPRATGYHVYRAPAPDLAGGGASAPAAPYTRLTLQPIARLSPLYIDRSAEPGAWRYRVTALAADGWESPASEPADATVGIARDADQVLRLVAPAPASHLAPGEPVDWTFMVVADRDVLDVAVHIVNPDLPRPTVVPALRLDAHRWRVHIPSQHIHPGILSMYAIARDVDDHHAYWPPGARRGLPWTFTVC